MPEPLQALESLPSRYGEIAAGFRRAARELALNSAASWPRAMLPATVFLRGGTLSTRLYVTRTLNELLFGFLRGAEQTDTIMDANVGFRVAVAERDFAAAPLEPASIQHTLVAPPFLAADVSPADARVAARVLGRPLESLFFLRLDYGILAVAEPENLDRARAAWQRPGSDWEPMVDPMSPRPGAPRAWRVGPFLALARTVGIWTRGGFEAGAVRPVHLPAAPDAEAEKAALFVLRQLAAGWIAAVNRIENRGSREPGDPIGRLTPTYEIRGYEARIVLRLDPQGRLARKGDRDDLFQLQVTACLEEDEPGVARSRITIGPPDFLASGRLYEAFLDSLEQDGAARRMAAELGIPGEGAAVRAYVRSARSATADAPLVFRVKQGRTDVDIVTLHGALNGLPQHVAVRAEFEVRAGDDPQVNLHERTLEVLYTDRPRGGLPPPERAAELVRYFMRLVMHLRDWHGALE